MISNLPTMLSNLSLNLTPRNELGFRTEIVSLDSHLESSNSFTYAILDGNAIKIGKSRWHPIQRLAVLQTGNPRKLELLAYSARLKERHVHRRLSRWSIRGEWFTLCREVLAYLDSWCWCNVNLLSRLVHETSTTK
jgi:hypothetical protein